MPHAARLAPRAPGWPHFRELEYATLVKATSLPEWALVDAGGGAVVDLDAATGEERLSARKVIALRRRALVIYIRVRSGAHAHGGTRGSCCAESALTTCVALACPPLQRDVRYLEHRIAKRAAAAAAASPAAPGGAPAGDKNRPALSATSDFATIMARRAPWYEAAAHLVIDGCDKDGSPRPKEALTAEVLRAFWARAEGAGRRGGAKAEVREQMAKAAAGVASLGQFLLG